MHSNHGSFHLSHKCTVHRAYCSSDRSAYSFSFHAAFIAAVYGTNDATHLKAKHEPIESTIRVAFSTAKLPTFDSSKFTAFIAADSSAHYTAFNAAFGTAHRSTHNTAFSTTYVAAYVAAYVATIESSFRSAIRSANGATHSSTVFAANVTAVGKTNRPADCHALVVPERPSDGSADDPA